METKTFLNQNFVERGAREYCKKKFPILRYGFHVILLLIICNAGWLAKNYNHGNFSWPRILFLIGLILCGGFYFTLCDWYLMPKYKNEYLKALQKQNYIELQLVLELLDSNFLRTRQLNQSVYDKKQDVNLVLEPESLKIYPGPKAYFEAFDKFYWIVDSVKDSNKIKKCNHLIDYEIPENNFRIDESNELIDTNYDFIVTINNFVKAKRDLKKHGEIRMIIDKQLTGIYLLHQINPTL